jgi:hypothetical protein
MNICSHSPYITPSLTRGWVYHLQLLLTLASAFVLGSDSRVTRDHILLSQIRDFPFCRLLRLTGVWWRYSTPPPHGSPSNRYPIVPYIYLARTTYKTQFPLYCCHVKGRGYLPAVYCCLHSLPWECLWIFLSCYRNGPYVTIFLYDLRFSQRFGLFWTTYITVLYPRR